MTARCRSFCTWMFSLLLVASLLWAGANLHMQREGIPTFNAPSVQPEATTDTSAVDAPDAEEADTVPQDEWTTLHGYVVTYTDNTLTIRTDADETLELGLGPLGYWLAHSIAFSPDDEVRVRGFYNEEEEFEPAEITNLTTGESVTLRDADGAPLWRGDH